MTKHVSCAGCGIEFCMPTSLYNARRRDHDRFYCPNGHSNFFPGKTEEKKRIEELEEGLKRARRWSETLSGELDEFYAQREDLIGALKECPIPGCSWRSRKQIPRDPVSMGRGIERVRHDLLEHFVRDHAGRANSPPLLPAGG